MLQLTTQGWETILNLIPGAVKQLPNDLQGSLLAKILPSLADVSNLIYV